MDGRTARQFDRHFDDFFIPFQRGPLSPAERASAPVNDDPIFEILETVQLGEVVPDMVPFRGTTGEEQFEIRKVPRRWNLSGGSLAVDAVHAEKAGGGVWQS